MVAHLASYAPLLGHRLVELLARLVKYLGRALGFPVTAPWTTAVVVGTPVATLDVLRVLAGHPFVPVAVGFAQRDGRRLHARLKCKSRRSRTSHTSPARDRSNDRTDFYLR